MPPTSSSRVETASPPRCPSSDGCTVSARFRPTAPGERELDVALIAPDSDEAIWVALAGVGTNPAPAPTPTPAPPPKPSAPGPAAPGLVRKGRPRIMSNGRLDTGWTATCPPGTTSCQVSALVVERTRPGKPRGAVLVRRHRARGRQPAADREANSGGTARVAAIQVAARDHQADGDAARHSRAHGAAERHAPAGDRLLTRRLGILERLTPGKRSA